MLQVAFDAAAEAMLIVDDKRRIHWANQASAQLLVNGVPIQVMNRNLRDLITLCRQDGSLWESAPLLDPESDLPTAADQGRFALRLADGSTTPMQRLRWQPVELVRAPFLLISLRNLGPEEQALLQQQQFMVDLTHELRTPLAIVTGCLQRMSRLDGLSQPLNSGLEMAREEVGRIHRLLENLSLMTRLEVDASLPGRAEHALPQLLMAWRDHLSAQDRQRVQLQIAESTGDRRVLIDANALQLVLDQLLDNGLRHGHATKPVLVAFDPGAAASGDPYRLTVSSFSREEPVGDAALERWQKPFSRGDQPRSAHQAEGAGLGLALVAQLVEAWDGRLSITQALATGWTRTDVNITLPRKLESGTPAAGEDVQTDPA